MGLIQSTRQGPFCDRPDESIRQGGTHRSCIVSNSVLTYRTLSNLKKPSGRRRNRSDPVGLDADAVTTHTVLPCCYITQDTERRLKFHCICCSSFPFNFNSCLVFFGCFSPRFAFRVSHDKFAAKFPF